MINYYDEMTTEEIRKSLIKASHAYYNKSESLMPDSKFDALKDELKRKNPEDPFFKTIGSPVPKSTGWIKEAHKIPMGSLEVVKDKLECEFEKWYKKVKEPQMIMEWKYDGISVSLEYEDGILVKALTRNDGKVGMNIYQNVSKMINVKKKLDKKWTGSIRGEIILTSNNFEFINEILRENDEEEFKNMRNGASGIATRPDGRFSEYLSVMFYDCTGDFEFEAAKIRFMDYDLGLKIENSEVNNGTQYENFIICRNVEECIHYYKLFESRRKYLSYEVDGVVLKISDVKYSESLGVSDNCPNGQRAWKFSSMTAETKILSVDRQYGLTGQITPVANLEPVKLCGVTISRSTVANYGIFESFNFHVNDTVVIVRNNDVIPGILENKGGGTILIDYPQICPICGEETVILENPVKENGEIVIKKSEYCPNDFCKGKELGNLKKWCDTIFEEKGFSDKTVELLYENHLISDPDDYYLIEESQLRKLPKFGKRKSEIILNVINAGRKTTLAKFIDGLNIENFGESRAETLIENGYKTIEDFLEITYEQLISIKGIGDSIAKSFIDGRSKKKLLIYDLLLHVEIIPEEGEEVMSNSNVFEGKSFLFTGAIQKINEATGKRYTRDLMEELVRQNGGIVGKSVNKDLHYLVQADPNSESSKTQKAKSIGVEIMSEDRFFEILGI